MFDPVAIADELRRAEGAATPIPLLSERYPDLTWDEARAVARARDELRRADGDRQIGYKLGWTSAAMREALGIEQPNWGTLWESQMLGSDVDVRRFLHAKVEPELVYRCGHGLSGAVSTSDVADACDGWALGLEVVDPRWPSFRFDWLDNTADNSSGAGVRLGEFAMPTAAPADIAVEFTVRGEPAPRTGTGSNAMGDPLAAVAWLADQLRSDGEVLHDGALVVTGGLTAPVDLAAGTHLELASEHLPSLTLDA